MNNVAKVAYDTYCSARHWKSFSGGPLPQFEEQSAELQDAWRAAAMGAVGNALDQIFGRATPSVQIAEWIRKVQ